MLQNTHAVHSGRKPRRIAALVVFLIALLFCFGALAQTTLTVDLKGLSTGAVGVWRSVPLTARFAVWAGEGDSERLLGQVTANPVGEEASALVIPDELVASAYLMPIEDDFSGLYDCVGPIRLQLTAGQDNPVSVFAYARQGYFTVSGYTAGNGEDAPAGSAEYVLLNEQDETALTFVSDENGFYASQTPLPAGAYHLVQMLAPKDTLPTEDAISFYIEPYLGSESNIASVEVYNELAPIENRTLSRISLTGSGAVGTLLTEAGAADMTVSGILDGDNTTEIADLTLSLGAAALRMADGQTRASAEGAALTSLSAALPDSAYIARATLYGVDGAVVFETPLTAEALDVSAHGAISADILYQSQNGDTLLPEGFSAGSVTASYRLAPFTPQAGDASLSSFDIPVSAHYSFQYPGSDGMSVVSDESQVSPAVFSITVDNGRTELNVLLEAAERDGQECFLLNLDTAASRNLPNDMKLILVLPRGARLGESALPMGCRLLRMENGDAVALNVSLLRAGEVALPVKAGGASSEAAIWALDPKTLTPTKDNPKGLSIQSDDASSDALLALMLGAAQDSTFAVIPCDLKGAFASESDLPAEKALLYGVMFEDSNLDGIQSEGENTPALEGVLLECGETLCYGAYTREDGTFTLHALQDSADTTGRLTASLPVNTASTEGQIGAYSVSDIALGGAAPTLIGYTRLCSVGGTVAFESGEGVAAVDMTLSLNGAEIAKTQTDPAGFYTFGDLGVTSGYTLTLTLDDSRDIALLADGVSGASVTTKPFALGYGEDLALNFSAAKLSTLIVSATKEGSPLSGVALTLRKDGNELAGVSGEDGLWRVRGLHAGDYELMLSVPAAAALTSLDGADVKALTDYTAAVTLAQGESKQLEAMYEATASLQGVAPDLGEGQYITAASLYDQFSVTTDGSGNYRFEGLPSGDYTIYAPLPSGKALPADSLWRMTQQGDMIWMTVSIQAGNLYQMPQANFTMMTGLKGMAFLDADGTGSYSAGDSPLSGVAVSLQRLDNGAWSESMTATTNEYGAYAFMSLEAGTYRVACSVTGNLFVSSVGASAQTDGSTTVSREIALSSGDVIASGYDVALCSPAALQIAAFVDSNQNGKRADNEKAVPGATVSIMGAAADGSEVVLAQGVTGDDGMATISGVRPGAHVVRVTLPSGYLFSKKGEGLNLKNSVTDRTDEKTQDSEPITFVSGETAQLGTGMIVAGTLGGKVWSDENSNGIMDEGEGGVAGVVITITGKRTGASFTLTSDSTGMYTFDRLRGDSYTITASLPEGMLFARYSKTGGDLRSIITTSGASTGSRDFTVEAGKSVKNKNIGVICEGGITGTAFYDLNYNGQYDEGEPGYAGVTVEIIKNSNNDSMGKSVTDEQGRFSVLGLRGGDYRVRAVLPNDGCFFTTVPAVIDQNSNQFVYRDGRRENSLASLTIGNGEVGSTVVGVARGAKLLGTVFIDADYDGDMAGNEKKVASLSVLLRDENGVLVSQTATTGKGAYAFDNVMPGVYTLYIERKAGYAFTRFNQDGSESSSKTQSMQDGYGIIPNVTVLMGQDQSGLNAGILQSATLTGTVYSDENDTGARDADEPGLPGVIVHLVSTDMERNPVDLTAETTESGAFLLDGVMPGAYDLTYTLPEHVEFAGTNDISRERTISVKSVTAGESRELDTVGAVVLGSLVGTAFDDSNANGVLDEGELPLAGVTITLTPSKASLEPISATTGADGAFALIGARPAEYTLDMTLPDGFIFSCDVTSEKLDAGTDGNVTLACPWAALISREPAALGAVQPATLSGFIGLDENRNGQQDTGEAMMSGITFELYDENQHAVVKTMTSDTDGQVWFTNVRPATYTVRYPLPEQAAPVASAKSGFIQNGDMMAQSGILLSEGEARSDLYGVLSVQTVIGGLVRLDEGGVLVPQNEVTVTLYKASGEMVGSTLTNEDGAYRFTGLWPDDYYLTVHCPGDMLFVSTEDERFLSGLSVITSEDGGVGRSDPFALKMAVDQLDKHVTFLKPGKVGDYAWLDENGNGLNDMTELPISGVRVTLFKNGAAVYSTETDVSGYYLFDNVYPGEYTLHAQTYGDLTITTRVSAIPILTSCLVSGDGDGAETEAFTVLSGEKYFDFDLGYVVKPGKSKPSGITGAPTQDWTISNTTKIPD